MEKQNYNGKNKLSPNDKQIAECRDLILNYLIASSYNGDVNEKINEIIDVCLYGWNRAPKDILTRVKLKLGRNSEAYKTISKQSIDSNNKTSFDISVYNLSEEEQKFLKDREIIYRKDYDFNDSSDLPLLIEILMLELTLRRLQGERHKKTKTNEIDKRVSYIQNQLMENMDKLGILRSQRIDQDSNIEGNVSQISVMVEKKLEDIKNIKDKNKKDKILNDIKEKFAGLDEEELKNICSEIIIQQEHDLQPEVNMIPEAEIEKMLKDLSTGG